MHTRTDGQQRKSASGTVTICGERFDSTPYCPQLLVDQAFLLKSFVRDDEQVTVPFPHRLSKTYLIALERSHAAYIPRWKWKWTPYDTTQWKHNVSIRYCAPAQ
jgi:hypothetical protein